MLFFPRFVIISGTKEKEENMPMEAINPTTGELIKTYPTMTEEDVNNIIQASHDTFLDWKTTTFAK